jgi:hypothetical protein
VIRVFVIGTALLYGQALIGCIPPKAGVSPGEELFSVSAEFDSVPFHNAPRHATHVITMELEDEDCPLLEAHQI